MYETRIAKAQADLRALDLRGARLANGRTLTFLAFAVSLSLVIFERLPRWGFAIALAALGAYVALAITHGGVLRAVSYAQALLDLNRRGIARIDDAWHDFPRTGASLASPEHLYAADLNVVGRASLFQRLDETGTTLGEAKLAAWLLTLPASAEVVRERQACARELAKLLDFRQRLILEARVASAAKVDPEPFIQWASSPSHLDGFRWAYVVAHVLPPLTIAAGLMAAATDVSGLYFGVGLLAQIAVVFATRTRMAKVWAALSNSEQGFVRFEDTFAAIDGQSFTTLALVRARGAPEASVSRRLARFAYLLGFAELRHSGQMHPIINALCLWDIHFLFRLDAWREAHGKEARGWFEMLAHFEAWSALGGWAFEHPADAYPNVDDGDVHFVATQLGHPLLAHSVRNDVTLTGPGYALIITGSNMSGKTTLLRAVGLNHVMALAGLPVCATSLSTSLAQTLISMRVSDSLERGVSYFYAEVLRVRSVLNAARSNPKRCLFLLDELFMGTNTRERQVASVALLFALLDSGAAGAVATHDLALCDVATDRPTTVRNVHFQDSLVGGEMTFDYRMRDGVVETTNALEVLRRAGVELSLPSR